MKTLCGSLLACVILLMGAPEAFTAAPPGKSKNGKGRGKVFNGIVTEVKRGKGRDHGTITVRGHDHAMKSKGQKGGKKGKASEGEKTTTTFHVGPKTLFLATGKGARVIHLNQIKEGQHVAIEHHGHHAEEVRVQQQGGKGKGKGKKK